MSRLLKEELLEVMLCCTLPDYSGNQGGSIKICNRLFAKSKKALIFFTSEDIFKILFIERHGKRKTLCSLPCYQFTYILKNGR